MFRVAYFGLAEGMAFSLLWVLGLGNKGRRFR